jgi:hypothetical protein
LKYPWLVIRHATKSQTRRPSSSWEPSGKK